MVKSLNAFRIVFNTLLSLVELLLGMRFLINLFGSDGAMADLVETVGSTLQQIGASSAQTFAIKGVEKSVSALVLVLGFMLFGFVLIVMMPAMVEKKERELELAEDDFD